MLHKSLEGPLGVGVVIWAIHAHIHLVVAYVGLLDIRKLFIPANLIAFIGLEHSGFAWEPKGDGIVPSLGKNYPTGGHQNALGSYWLTLVYYPKSFGGDYDGYKIFIVSSIKKGNYINLHFSE